MKACTHSSYVLFPDCSSSGIWCADCGIMISPEKDEKIPEALIHLIFLWNEFWDYKSVELSDLTEVHKEFCQRLIDETGEYLATLMNIYYPCYFDKEKSYLVDWNFHGNSTKTNTA